MTTWGCDENVYCWRIPFLVMELRLFLQWPVHLQDFRAVPVELCLSGLIPKLSFTSFSSGACFCKEHLWLELVSQFSPKPMGCLLAWLSWQPFCSVVQLRHSSSTKCNAVSPVVLAKTLYNGPNIYLHLQEYFVGCTFLKVYDTVVML